MAGRLELLPHLSAALEAGSIGWSMAELLARHGVTYINTPFGSMANAVDVQHGVFGLDSGVMTVDRGDDLLDWDVTRRDVL